MKYIKKYWKRLFWIIVLISFPFVLEWSLFYTPIISRFSNETWFSFMSSYVGAVITIAVMYITFKKSDEENKKIIEQQKKQHDIEKQNEKLAKIIHVLLLDDYYFLNIDTVGENIDRFLKDLHYVQLDTLKFKYITDKNEKLMEELLELQMEEIKIINSAGKQIPHVDSEQKAMEFKKYSLDVGLKLSTAANLKREIIKIMYDDYLENVYKEYYK